MSTSATPPILDQVLAASPKEKHVILNALLEEWVAAPSPSPLNDLGPPQVDENGNFTPLYLAELKRRISEDHGAELGQLIDELAETPVCDPRGCSR